MATRVLTGYRLFKDSGDVCTDGTATFYLANTTTLQEVFSDKDLTISLGSSVSFSSTGVAPDIWVSDAISIKVIIAGTGCTSDTIDYLTVAASTVAGTTTADVSLGNALINGGFSSWTPGTSYSNISGSGTGVEVADEWFFVQNTAASNAISRQTASGAQARYALRFGRPAGSTSTNKLRLHQMLATEMAYRLRGQEVTLSFRAKAGANFSGTSLGVRIATGTSEGESGDLIEASGFGGAANPLNTTQAITTTATRYEFTCTLSGSLKEIGIQLAYTGVGTAGAADYVDIEDVQLEIADAATSFKQTPEPLEFLTANLSSAFRTFMGTPSSANLASWVSDETGSGALVFATSPTLTTPVLGVATATSVTATSTVAATHSLTAKNTNDAASVAGLRIEGDRVSMAANDNVYMSFYLSDSAGNQDEMARIRCLATDVTSGSNDARIDFAVAIADTLTTVLLLTGTNLSSNTNDQLALGSATIGFADLHLASGGVINWANGNAVLTHSSGVLNVSTGVLQVGGVLVNVAGKQAIPVNAAAMIANTTNGPSTGITETTTNKVMVRTLDYDQTTQEGAQFHIPMPKSWNESTVTFQVCWTAASGSGGVVWELRGVALSDDDALDTAFGTGQTSTDTLITANDVHWSPESSAITIAGTPAEGDWVAFQLRRNVSDGSDTLNADAKVIAVRLFITTNASNDA